MLLDFWKHWAQVLKVDREPFKLDLNKESNIATNFTCHGAAATVKGKDGRRRFAVWDGYELHGDVGERLGLKNRLTSKEWTDLLSETHPGAQVKDASNRKVHHWCLDNVCPTGYIFP